MKAQVNIRVNECLQIKENSLNSIETININ